MANRICHIIGIPLIVLGLLGLLAIPVAYVRGWRIELPLILVFAAGLVNVWLDFGLGALMLLNTFAIYLGARLLIWQFCAGMFIVGWIVHFVGHSVHEKWAPAFYKNGSPDRGATMGC